MIEAETSFPSSQPRHLLLMTWLSECGAEPVDRIDIDEVRQHNAVVVSQAEQQWS
jgi:hypothetical protein